MQKRLLIFTFVLFSFFCGAANADWQEWFPTHGGECVNGANDMSCQQRIPKGDANNPINIKCELHAVATDGRGQCCCNGTVWVPDPPTNVDAGPARVWQAVHIYFDDPGTPVDHYEIYWGRTKINWDRDPVIRKGSAIKTMANGRKFVAIRMPEPKTSYRFYIRPCSKWYVMGLNWAAKGKEVRGKSGPR